MFSDCYLKEEDEKKKTFRRLQNVNDDDCNREIN